MRLTVTLLLCCGAAAVHADEPERKSVKLSEAVRQLSSDDAGKRNRAAALIILFAKDAAPATGALTKLVADENADVRRHAVCALGAIGPGAKAAAEVLHKAAREDENPSVRAWAGVDAGRAKDAVGDLTTFLAESTSAADRVTAIDGLAAVGSKDALPVLKKLGDGQDEAERAAAKRAMAAIHATALFKFTFKREDDAAKVRVEGEVAVLDVTSPTGIGTAAVERAGEAWPQQIPLRLHLTGLESFSAKCGQNAILGFVGVRGQSIKLTADGKDRADDLGLRAVQDGKTTTARPLTDGYIEMRLPKGFFAGNPKAFELAWVDWLRR
jgi:hypothetical protein